MDAAASDAKTEPKRKDYWIALESNPAVLTKFAWALGVPPKWGFSDCLGLDEELLSMVPTPCYAIILLAPYSKLKEWKKKEKEEIEKIGQYVSPKVYFMKQLVGNACGCVAVVHALANNRENLELEKTFFTEFLEKTRDVNPYERGRLFGLEEQLKVIAERFAKDEEAQTESHVLELSSTQAPAADASIDFHFVCFAHVDGHLYELDGAKEWPINHGPTTPANFLQDAARVIREKFIARLQDDLHFSVISFGPASLD